MKVLTASELQDLEQKIVSARAIADFELMRESASLLQTTAAKLLGRSSVLYIKGLLFEAEAICFRFRDDEVQVGTALKKVALAHRLAEGALPSAHSLFVDMALLYAECYRTLSFVDDAFGFVLNIADRIPAPGYPLPGSISSAVVQRLFAGLSAYSNNRPEEAVSFFESAVNGKKARNEHPALYWYGLISLLSLDVANDAIQDARESVSYLEQVEKILPEYITRHMIDRKHRVLGDMSLLGEEFSEAYRHYEILFANFLDRNNSDAFESEVLQIFSTYQRRSAYGHLLNFITDLIIPTIQKSSKPLSRLLGMCYEWAGETCLSLQRFDSAGDFFAKACDSYEDDGEVDDAVLANVFHNLGALKLTLKEEKEAESLLTKALTIRQRYFGQSHPEVAKTMSALGVAQQKLGKLDESKRLFQLLSDSFSHLLSEDHPAIRQARFFLEQKETPVKSTKERETETGASSESDGKNVAVLFNEAMMHFHGRNFPRAVLQLEDLIAIISRTQGKSHPDNIPLLETLSSVYNEMGLSKKASAYKERATALKSKS